MDIRKSRASELERENVENEECNFSEFCSTGT